MNYIFPILFIFLSTSLHAAILPPSLVPQPRSRPISSDVRPYPSNQAPSHPRPRRVPLAEEADASDEYYPIESANFVPVDSRSLRVAEMDREAEEDDTDNDGIEDDFDQSEDDSEQSEDDSESEDQDSAQDNENGAEERVRSERKQKAVSVTSRNRLSVPKSVRASTTKKSKKQGKGFKGIPLGVVDGTNVTHLSYMVFKLIKTHEIKSVVDIPCRNTLSWFPQLLQYLDFEIVGFKYYCIDSEKHSQDDIRPLFSDAASPEFMHIRPDEANLIPKTDLVFCWDGPQQWGVKKTWAFFTALRQIHPKYLMITNNPGALNTNDKRGLINLRKQPFHVRYLLFLVRLSSSSHLCSFFGAFLTEILASQSTSSWCNAFWWTLLVCASNEGYFSDTWVRYPEAVAFLWNRWNQKRILGRKFTAKPPQPLKGKYRERYWFQGSNIPPLFCLKRP